MSKIADYIINKIQEENEKIDRSYIQKTINKLRIKRRKKYAL